MIMNALDRCKASWRQDILSCQEQGTSQVFGGGGGHRIVQRVGHE